MKLNTKSLLYGTCVLTIANFTVRLLGFVYRVVLSRMIGPQGMGLVQLIFPVYIMAITLTISGIPIAVSRLISEKTTSNDHRGIRKIIFTSAVLVVIISLIISTLLLINIDFISENIIGDNRTRGALFVFFPSIIIVSLGAVLKGYFYGTKNIHPPAISEIIEQLCRMAIAMGLIYLLPPLSHAEAAALVILAMVMGELFSLLYLHYSYKKSHKKSKSFFSLLFRISPNNKPFKDLFKRSYSISNKESVLSRIVQIALPITLTRLVSSFMNAFNTILIPQRLVAGGMLRNDAVGTFGILSGMTMPLLFLPFTITSALTVVIIPNLSQSLVEKKWTDIRDKISKAVFITSMTAFPSMAILIIFGQHIGDFLYKQPEAGQYLLPLSMSLVFHALQHTSNGILNGLGKQNQGAIHFFIGSTIQIICTYFLAADPRFGIYGFIVGFIMSSIIVSALNIFTILKTSRLSFPFTRWILKPAFSALLMASIMRLVFIQLLNCQISTLLSMVLSLITGMIIFIISTVLTGTVSISSFMNVKSVLKK